MSLGKFAKNGHQSLLFTPFLTQGYSCTQFHNRLIYLVYLVPTRRRGNAGRDGGSGSRSSARPRAFRRHFHA